MNEPTIEFQLDRLNEAYKQLKHDFKNLQETYRYDIAQLTKERDELKAQIEQCGNAIAVPRAHELLGEANPECACAACNLHRRYKRERDQLAAKCAALTELSRSSYSLIIEHHSSSQMREELIECSCCVTKRGDDILNKLHAAYTNPDQCGVGWFKKCPQCGYENH